MILARLGGTAYLQYYRYLFQDALKIVLRIGPERFCTNMIVILHKNTHHSRTHTQRARTHTLNQVNPREKKREGGRGEGAGECFVCVCGVAVTGSLCVTVVNTFRYTTIIVY